MPRFNIELLGDKELSEVLRQLPEKIEKKSLTKAIKDAASIVLDDAERLAPRGETGRLARFLKIKALKRKRGRIGYTVQAGKREQLGIKADASGYYPAHTELGFEHYHKAEFGEAHVPARPFLRPALINNEAQVLGRIRQNLRTWLESGLK